MSYLNKDKYYYFAGENIVQGLNNRNDKDYLESVPEDQSMMVKTNNMNMMNMNIQEQEEPVKKRDPIDLGKDVYDFLKEEHYRKQKIQTNSSDYLIRIYDILKTKVKDIKRKEKEEQKLQQTNPKLFQAEKNISQRLHKTGFNQDKKHLDKQKNEATQYENKIKVITSYRRDDIYHTLQIHCEMQKMEENQKREQEKNEQMLKDIGKSLNQNKKTFDEQTLNRLYPKNNFGVSKATKQQEFMIRLQQLVYENRFSIDYSKYNENDTDIEVYTQFWKGYNNKVDEPIINIDIKSATDYIEQFFKDAAEMITKRFQGKYGIKETNPQKLIKFYRKDQNVNLNEIRVNRKQETQKPLYFDFQSDKRLSNLLVRHFEQIQKEADIRRLDEIENERIRDRKEEKKNKRLKQKTTEETFERLKKPKDRLKLGKTLLNLKRLYPMDMVLTKMIVQEFRNTKLTKYPEEYEQYDSDEEELVQEVNPKVDRSKDQLQEQLKQKESQIVEFFYKDIQEYHQQKQSKMAKSQIQKKSDQQLDKKVDRMVLQSAIQFIELRKQRFERKVPSINEYLVELYHQLKDSYYENVKKRFLHLTYGESKKRQQKSFPLKFKRFFFEVVKSVIKSTLRLNKKKKLGFWAPTSQRICGYHEVCPIGCNYQTYNKKILGLSQNKKDEKVYNQLNNKTAWEDKDLQKERLQIMMKYDDAQQCIFQPLINQRAPFKGSATVNIPNNPPNFQKWVERMGTNFVGRFPVLYKYGIYRISLQLYKKGNYIKSYMKISEAFRIDDIIKYFDADKWKQPDPKSMFVQYHQDKDMLNKIMPENFDNKKYVTFLEDVFQLILALQEYDQNLLKVRSNIEKLMEEERKKKDPLNKLTNNNINSSNVNNQDALNQTYDNNDQVQMNRKQYKERMCPLKDRCPDDQRPRWPSSNRTTVSSLGKECPYAHHTYELKFRKEVESRAETLKRMLKSVNKKIDGNDGIIKEWNPAAGPLTGCIGCGAEIMFEKGGSKGNCKTCKLQKMMQTKLDNYKLKAKLKYTQILKNNQFQKNQIKTKGEQQKLQIKIKLINKANIFYKKERFVDAFEQICQAIIIVKQELIEKEKYLKKSNKKLKKKLCVDDSEIKLDKQMAYKIQRGKSVELGDQKAQKVFLYAKKAGIIEDNQKGDVHDFINNQIEQLYYKIELALMKTKKDIRRLNNRIEHLESNADQTKFKLCPQKMKCHDYQVYLEKQQLLKGNKTIHEFKVFLEKQPRDFQQCCLTKIENCRNKQECPMKMKPCCQTKTTGCVHYEKWKKLAIKECKKEYKEWSQDDDSRQIIKHVKLYAHKPNQLELVGNQEKVENMENTVKLFKSKINEAPEDWKYVSRMDKIMDIDELNTKNAIDKTVKGQKEKKDQTLYDKDIQLIATMPQNRSQD